MAEARYPCPKCGATLKLANEVPAGKKIRCPKCQAAFAPVAEAKAKPQPAPARPKIGEEGTYGVVSEPGPPPKDDEDDQPKSTHEQFQEQLEKKFPKSKRGPAQAIVIKPANQLLATSSLACVSCIVSVVVALWPMFFAKDPSKDPDAFFVSTGTTLKVQAKNPAQPVPPFEELTVQRDGSIDLGRFGQVKVVDKKIPDVELLIRTAIEKVDKSVGPIDVQVVTKKETAFGWMWIAASVAAFAYNGLIVYGAVSMQNVESYNWAMAGSFLMLAPSNWACAVPAFGWFLMFAQNLAGDEMAYATVAVISLWYVYVGVWNVKTLRNPEVEAGFREKKQA